ncbi:MAG TPA: ABC transporter permease subunit [Candidatus Pelethocola excrementipullorum]|nr:ABC transporter permease subunit [Candidatus Pelethocola excrementipullorum]
MKMFITSGSRKRKLLIFAFWLIIWQAASMVIHNSIVFVGPAEVLNSLWNLLPTQEFWLSIAYSFLKISLGFLSAFLIGILLGCISFRIPILRELLEPLILLCKAVPVASFVILALIVIGSKNLSILISFIIVLPVIFTNTLTGLENTDPKLLEMAQVFRMTPWKRMRYLYWPTLSNQLSSGCKVALGMSWKSGIAAEVIGVPAFSIGEKLYMAKIYLNTADLFAWTVVILLLSALFEWLFLRLFRKIR